MQTRATTAVPLASRPDLDQYRILAKELVKAARSDDPSALRAPGRQTGSSGSPDFST